MVQELDQWDAVEKFAEHHVQALDTKAGFRRFCSPKIGHLLAHDGGGFQISHHVQQDGGDNINDNDEGNIWAFMGAGSTAPAVFLSCTYDKQTSVSHEWSKMVQWAEIKDVAMTHPIATKLLGDAKSKAKG